MVDSHFAPANGSGSKLRPVASMMSELLHRYRKILGFVGFGALAGATYALILVVGVDVLRAPTFLASSTAFALAIPVSYFGNRLVTYRSRNIVGPEFARFLVVQVANLLITSGIVHVVTERLSLPSYAGIAVAFVSAPVVSLILFELWVYRQRQGKL